ncbi:MAG: BamA/TamA family outer membrane protein [Gemmatimonadetes bacterium]|nr:BamA/TamA family outer membrane protein [Gemmatimonadota bacterium]
MRASFRFIVCGVSLLGTAPSVAAQDTAIVIHPESTAVSLERLELPRIVADEVIRFYNAPTTTRLVGRTMLPRGNEWRGDVAVLTGPVMLRGRVQGTLVVINGDAVLDPGAEITGDLIVVGGTVTGAPDGVIRGAVRAYREPLAYRLAGEEIVYAPNLRRRLRILGVQHTWGTADSRSSLRIATSGTFNRIEGLPIVFGPLFDWRLQPNVRFRLDALGVFRSAGDLSDRRSDLGYMLRGELRSGERRGYGIGFRAYDVITPIESWGLRNSEIGWAAFLFHRDYRDYYLNKGFGGRVFVQPERPLHLSLELRRESHTTVAARDPWSVFRNDQAWRPNPPIDEGHYTTLAGTVTLDTRNDQLDPTSGWLVSATVERSRSTDVVPQPGLPAAVRDSIPTGGTYAFTHTFFDVRRYTRVSPTGRVNLRLVAGGWLGGDPLPIQRRLSLGGPDPIPGSAFRQVACSGGIVDPAFAGTQVAACDRVLVAQAEYRGHMSLRWVYNPPSGEGDEIEEGRALTKFWLEGLDLVVFGNAGQGWLVGSGPSRVPSDKIPTLSGWIADLGLGIDWGGFGVYAAKAVTVGEPIRFTVRLDHRF